MKEKHSFTQARYWVDEAPLNCLEAEPYWKIIQAAVNRLVGMGDEFSLQEWTLHERVFALTGLLLLSPLGGCCWPRAERDVCDLKLAQLAHMFEPPDAENRNDWLLVNRFGIGYPIFVSRIVQFGLLLLVVQRMSLHPTRNNGLAPLNRDAVLGPSPRKSIPKNNAYSIVYRKKLLQKALQELAVQIGWQAQIDLCDFVAVGRYLMLDLYELDVLYATLGSLKTTAPPREQLCRQSFHRAIFDTDAASERLERVCAESPAANEKALDVPTPNLAEKNTSKKNALGRKRSGKPNSKALALVFALRSHSGQVLYAPRQPKHTLAEHKNISRAKMIQQISNAQFQLGKLPDDEHQESAALVLGWLREYSSSAAPRSIHLVLDDMCMMLAEIKDTPIERYLEAISAGQTDGTGLRQTELSHPARYFSTLRSFYRYAVKHKKIRLGIEIPRAKQKPLRMRRMLTLDDICNAAVNGIAETSRMRQSTATSVTVSENFKALLLVSLITGFRINDCLALQLGDVNPTSGLEIIAGMPKNHRPLVARPTELLGEKISWAVEFIRRVWTKRLQETGMDLHARFFVGALFDPFAMQATERQNDSYQNIYRFSRRIGLEDGAHSLRRFLANDLRAHESSLLDVVNALGHSTIGTAPANYLQVYPLLQSEQLTAWLEQQCCLSAPADMPMKSFAQLLGISREGAFRLLQRWERARGREKVVQRRNLDVALDLLIESLCFRVRQTQIPVQVSEYL